MASAALPDTGPPERLRRSTKLAYGIGLGAEGIKANAFNTFLLFYYQQVAGLDALLCGAALFLALCVDAITDPAVGLWSDGVRSRLGRRHPFMYASSLPLALCFVAVFHPPHTDSSLVLFGWLLVFSVGTRLAMTFFSVPHQSLVAELTHDYDERTELQSGRNLFSWLFGLVNVLLAYTVFLPPPGDSPFDPAGFSGLALFGGTVMMLSTLASSAGTQRAAIAAQALQGIKSVPIKELFREIRTALGSRNYRVVVIGGFLGAAAFGVNENMQNSMNLFFWGFAAEEVAVFIVVIAAAAVLVMFAAPRLAGRYGKARLAIVAALVTGVMTPVMVGLRLLGALPEAGSPALLSVLCVSAFVGYAGVMTGFVMVGAMIADITDEHEQRVGARQEGLLFAANTLIMKAASGLGPLLAGVVVSLAAFPEGATREVVPSAVLRNLGIFVSMAALLPALIAAAVYRRYRLTREVHAGIVASLGR